MTNVPPLPLSPNEDRERAIATIRATTELPRSAACALALTLDAVSAAVLHAAGIADRDARAILAALWRPERITDPTPTPRPRPTMAERDREFLRDLGQRIHVIRHARRLTPTGVQARTGIPAHLLRDIEAGAAWPSTRSLLHLADAFQVPLPMLVDEKATPLRILRLLAELVA
jgi:hypothetical protein